MEIWRQHDGRIDLLLTDLIMPEGMSGRHLAERLQAQSPRLRVIFSSGYSIDFSDQDLRLEQGVNFLAKPYDISLLIATVRHRLDGRTA
jgi:CheY-like chemotaxis protein